MVALAQRASSIYAASAKPPQASDITIPADLGYVLGTHRLQSTPAPTAATTAPPLIICIQDAHTNYDAQKRLAAIVDRLAAEHGLRLVLVEGGEGDVGLSYLRQQVSDAVLRDLAGDYLRRGLIAGEEYLDLTSTHPLLLRGVDDPWLYEQHMRIFLTVDAARASVDAELTRLVHVVEARLAREENGPLLTLRRQRAQADAGALEFKTYAAGLVAQASQHTALSDATRHMEQFVEASALEGAIALLDVSREQAEALVALRQAASAETLASLKTLSDQARADSQETAALGAFYRALRSGLDGAKLDRARWPHLRDYLRYWELKDGLDLRALSAEARVLFASVQAKLVRDADEARLVAMADGLQRLQGLVRLTWTPEDYAESRARDDLAQLRTWLTALREGASAQELAELNAVKLETLLVRLREAVRFYETAAKRDEELVRRALDELARHQQSVAVLIAGGFHTEHVKDLLIARGAEVVVITPLVGEEPEGSTRYADILKSKYHAWKARTQAARAH